MLAMPKWFAGEMFLDAWVFSVNINSDLVTITPLTAGPEQRIKLRPPEAATLLNVNRPFQRPITSVQRDSNRRPHLLNANDIVSDELKPTGYFIPIINSNLFLREGGFTGKREQNKGGEQRSKWEKGLQCWNSSKLPVLFHYRHSQAALKLQYLDLLVERYR
uniref:Uncharacterized protein n=1 Tax=Timema genevievae TaxID=629358 RepID=A0A7R9K233_TIMGE|nr:unnamed protein product [Timema genevievae]